MTKEIKHTDLIVGQYYVASRRSWDTWYIQIKEVVGNDVDVFVSITKDGAYYSEPNWSSSGDEWRYTPASPKEIRWIQECLKKDCFIPITEIKELNYEIY